MVVFLKPVIQVNLIEVGSHGFFAQFVVVRTKEWYIEPCQNRDERLKNAIRISWLRIARLYLRQAVP